MVSKLNDRGTAIIIYLLIRKFLVTPLQCRRNHSDDPSKPLSLSPSINIEEQNEVAMEISDALSAPIGFNQEIDDVSLLVT